VQLVLVDQDPVVARALHDAFAGHPEVAVHCGDLLALAENTAVSPANGQGFMDGGIDRAYTAFFGMRIERDVQDAIGRRAEGCLPLGAALLVPTHHPRIPYLIVATTMLMPEAVDQDHAYRAMRAVLRTAALHPGVVSSIYCPGLGTGVGMVPAPAAATAMASAYADWKATLPVDQG
jgi:O-acetyl-ADP-ribose deacetylase (regulator of RNase III)